MAKIEIKKKKRSYWFVLKESISLSWQAARWDFIFASFFNILGGLTSLLWFGSFALVVNKLQSQGLGANITKEILLIVFGNIAIGIIWRLKPYFEEKVQRATDLWVVKLRMDKVKDLDIGTLESQEFQNLRHTVENKSVGAIMSIRTDFLQNVMALSGLIGSVIILLGIDFYIVPIVILGCVPIYFVERHLSRLGTELWDKQLESERRFWIFFWHFRGLQNAIQLHLFHLGDFFKTKILGIRGEHDKEQIALQKKNLKGWGLFVDILFSLVIGLCAFYLVHKVRSGVLLFGSLFYALNTLDKFQSDFSRIARNFAKNTEYIKYASSMFDFLAVKPLIPKNKHTKKLHFDTPPLIEFKNVSFAYPDTDRVVLRDISLVIPGGSKLAIVGLNGAGKTTLIKLLTRVYDPTEGEVLVNGKNLKEIDAPSWHTALGILFQDYFMYEDTLENNIWLGDITKKLNEKDIVRASRLADSHGFIEELPLKYKQESGKEFNGGIELSKGQRQKVALARVIYRDAPITILDEPTSAIDAVSEEKIFRNLESMDSQHTVVLISHKFSNVRDADKIILIQDGSILEQGNHDELMALGGKYKELFELQAEGYR